jgi:type I restriction enzyme, S subunit
MINTVPLGEVAFVAMGSAPPGNTYNDTGEGLPMIAGAGDYGEKYPEPKKWTTAPSRVTEIGDLIVCVRATIGDLNWANKKYCLGRGVAGLRAKKGKLDINYAAHYINAKKHDLAKLGTGSTFLAIRRADLEDFPILLPPLAEQKRIAAILDKADAIRRKRQQAIKLADDFLRATFLDMFGDPVTNPKGFPLRKLSEFYVNEKDGTKCGPFGSALKKDELVKFGIPVWNMDNIDLQGQMSLPFRMWVTEEKYMQLRSYSVEDGDIIISRAGTVGKMCVAKMGSNPSIISTNLIRLRLGSELLPTYFVSLMKYCKDRIGKLRTGKEGAFTHMNTGILDNLIFPHPSIDLQYKYISIFKAVEVTTSKLHNSSNDQENLTNSLTQRAFRGEL